MPNTYTSLRETKASFNWTSQTEGEYAASVYAYIGGNSSYFKNSDATVSAGQKYEALFGSSSPTAITSSGTLTGFSVSTSFNNSAKPGVTYSVERASVDAAGNAGTYAAVPLLYKDYSATSALGAADLTADVLGILPYTSVYDKLPTTPGEYQYRVKATKGTLTQTKEIPSSVTVDPCEEASVSSISIGTATGTDSKTYAVTPALSYKGVLQMGDKLVIYYVKDSNYSVAWNDPLYIRGRVLQGRA